MKQGIEIHENSNTSIKRGKAVIFQTRSVWLKRSKRLLSQWGQEHIECLKDPSSHQTFLVGPWACLSFDLAMIGFS